MSDLHDRLQLKYVFKNFGFPDYFNRLRIRHQMYCRMDNNKFMVMSHCNGDHLGRHFGFGGKQVAKQCSNWLQSTSSPLTPRSRHKQYKYRMYNKMIYDNFQVTSAAILDAILDSHDIWRLGDVSICSNRFLYNLNLGIDTKSIAE